MKKIRLTSYFLTILFFTLSGFKGFDRPANNEVIQLGSKREIFVDNYLIDKLVNTRIVMHSPIDEGVVLYFDKRWEGIFCTYSTVIKDGGIYRTYYRGLPMAGKDGTNMETTCIAES